MTEVQEGRPRARRALVVAAVLVLIGVAVPAARAAGVPSEKQLDARLSLIGGCAKPEALDPVQDPGCEETPPPSGHPAKPFAAPMAVATDAYGNVYVSNFGKKLDGSEGRVDIFDPEGVFIGEVVPPHGPTSIALDTTGVLYAVVENKETNRLEVLVYTPTSGYDPAAGAIAYESPPASVELAFPNYLALYLGIAVNPTNDHLFANFGAPGTDEYTSAAEGNTFVRATEPGVGAGYGVGVAVDASHHLLYASHNEERIDVFDLNQVTGSNEYEKVDEIPGSTVPEGSFGNYLSIAVDEATHHVFVLDGENNKLYEFDEGGSYLSTLEHAFFEKEGAEIAVDNGAESPNGALDDLPAGSGRYLFVPSGRTGTGHSFAFDEPHTEPPVVESVAASDIGETEAELQAVVNPGKLATHYSFEYLTQQAYEEAGESFAGASVAGGGILAASPFDAEAFAVASGLAAGTRYRFRVVATNAKGEDEGEGSFSTYPHAPVEADPCPNGALRRGPSALLPDCRAYELVTPADTNARAPIGTGPYETFPNRQVSPVGDRLPFRVTGGSIPGLGGTGAAAIYSGDTYLSNRGPAGWNTVYTGPAAAESQVPAIGGSSPDQGYSFWVAQGGGSAMVEGKSTTYLRYPDGHSELLGRGSVGTDLEAGGLLIGEDGAHVIFASGNRASTFNAVQLEPNAAPDHTEAIYDRAPDGTLRVVSLKPGNLPFSAGEDAVYQGASLDGKGVAFKVGSTLYLRYDDSASYAIGEGVEFAGVAEGGNRVFYVEGGRLWRFDALNGERTPFSNGAVTPVTVSRDGSAAYLVSTEVLTGAPNPNGAVAQAGQENLYLSREGSIAFVGTVTERDVVGAEPEGGGLGLWLEAIGGAGNVALDPARASADGSSLLFESRANLAGYDPEGHAEVYRYDSAHGELQCLSCNPTGASASSEASLQSGQREGHVLFYPRAWLANLRADGRRAFFQSGEALVPGDTDGLQDIYEWEAQGVGSCTNAAGCIYLISSGHSARDDYLWAVSESGDDAFFLTSDLLLGSDADETPSIYDARVGGGFPETAPSSCEGEGCRPELTPAPPLPPASTPVLGAGENFKHRCARRKAKAGKRRCSKKHHRKHHRRAGANQKGGRK